ncbi:MAG: hypothetical protein KTR31_04225 [Myxococcales bacterium]|nr:hypothetical protein [Myxococcales bacterium]
MGPAPGLEQLDARMSLADFEPAADLQSQPLSDGLSTIPEDDTAPPTADVATEAPAGEEPVTPDGGGRIEGASEETSGEESAEHTEEDAEQTEDEAQTEEGNQADEAPSESSEEEPGDEAGAATETAIPQLQELGIVPPRPARIGGTKAPTIEQPPPLSSQQTQNIRTTTRLTPDEHHDRVRQGINRLSRLAHRAQLDIIHLVESASEGAYGRIHEIARRIPGVVGGAIASVRASLDATIAEVDAVAEAQVAAIGEREEGSQSAADAREELTLEGVEQAIATSNPQMVGAWEAVKADVMQAAQPFADEIRGTPQLFDASASGPALADTIEGESTSSDVLGYVNERIAMEVPALARQKSADMARGAERQADDFVSDEFMTQFALQFLQVLNPALVATETTATENEQTQTSEAGETRLVLASAREQALAVIDESKTRARATLQATRDQTIEGLQRTGRMASQTLFRQAESARLGVLHSADPFAQAYRQLMAAFRASFAPGQFFDHTQVQPRLIEATSDLEGTLEAQTSEVHDNVDASVQSAEDAARQQIDSIHRTVGQARQAAATASGEATTMMTSMAEHFTRGMDGETELLEGGSESFFALAGRELGETQPQRVVDTFHQTIHGPAPGGGSSVVDGFATQAQRFRDNYRDQLAASALRQGFEQAKAFDSIIDAANNELHDRSSQYDNAANSGFMGGAGTDEDAMLQALMGLTAKGMEGLKEKHVDEHGITLLAEAEDELSGEGLGDDLATARSLIAGNNAEAAVHIAHSSTSYWGLSRETREMAIRSLTPEERAEMTSHPSWASAAEAVSQLPQTEADITQALVEGETARAFALHLDERLEGQRRRVNEDGIQDVVNGMERDAAVWIDGPFRAGRVDPAEARELTVGAFREHATQIQGRDPEEVAAMGDAEVAGLFADHATRTMRQWVQHSEHHGEYVDREMSTEGAAAIRDTVVHGAGSPQSRASRLIYEQDRASTGAGVTETRTERIMDVAENPALRQARQAHDEALASGDADRIRAASDALQRQEEQHRLFMVHYAEQTGASPDVVDDPQALEDHVAGSLGDTFAGEGDHGRRFGESMVREGRVDLLAATMLATEGLGTHESLLKRAYQGRSPEEFDQLREDYQDETGDDLDDVLFDDTFSELSGDDAIDLRRIMRGPDTTDLDRMRNMFAYSEDELQGTGRDGRNYMAHTAEGDHLERKRRDAKLAILDALDERDVPPEQRWAFDEQGNPNPLAFSDDGTFLGDRTQFLLTTGDLRHGADSYRAELEQAESMLTSIIQAVGAVVGVLLMFVPGVNMVVAGIVTALVIGAMTMSVKYGMRGSRYGWEEAAVDVGTTAVDAATAGLGGIGQSARVAGTAARTSSALAKSVGREALSGFVSTSANTAMQDQIWADGFGAGLGRVISSGARGALVGAVTAGVSDGLSNKLDAALNPRVISEATEGGVGRLSQAARRSVSESLSEAAGSVAGEVAGTGFDLASGAKVDAGQVLGNIAFAAARDFVTGGLRGRVMSHQQGRMRDASRRALTQDSPPTRQQLRDLHRLAITTGDSHHGRRNFAEFAADFHARRQALADLPPQTRRDFADLPVDGLLLLRSMIDRGASTEPQREALAAMLAQGGLADIRQERVDERIEQALSEGTSPRARPDDDAPAARERVRDDAHPLGDLPPSVRQGLADLPEPVLPALRMLQARGEASPGEKARLLDRALKANRDLDVDAFLSAVDATVRDHSGRVPVTEGQHVAHREQLMAGLHPDLHDLFAGVPVHVVRSEVFDAATRNAKGDAVTILVNGQPQVLLREGASDPAHALREEGLHLAQLTDVRWAQHARRVSEEVAGRWDELSLAQRVDAHRHQVALEIDAQRTMLADLRRERASVPNARLDGQIAVVTARLRGLETRQAELAALGPFRQLMIGMGRGTEPDYLAQPARLFMESEGPATERAPDVDDLGPSVAVRNAMGAERVEIVERWLTGGQSALEASAPLRREISALLSSPLASHALAAQLARGSMEPADAVRRFGMLAEGGDVPSPSRERASRLVEQAIRAGGDGSVGDSATWLVAGVIRSSPTDQPHLLDIVERTFAHPRGREVIELLRGQDIDFADRSTLLRAVDDVLHGSADAQAAAAETLRRLGSADIDRFVASEPSLRMVDLATAAEAVNDASVDRERRRGRLTDLFVDADPPSQRRLAVLLAEAAEVGAPLGRARRAFLDEGGDIAAKRAALLDRLERSVTDARSTFDETAAEISARLVGGDEVRAKEILQSLLRRGVEYAAIDQALRQPSAHFLPTDVALAATAILLAPRTHVEPTDPDPQRMTAGKGAQLLRTVAAEVSKAPSEARLEEVRGYVGRHLSDIVLDAVVSVDSEWRSLIYSSSDAAMNSDLAARGIRSVVELTTNETTDFRRFLAIGEDGTPYLVFKGLSGRAYPREMVSHLLHASQDGAALSRLRQRVEILMEPDYTPAQTMAPFFADVQRQAAKKWSDLPHPTEPDVLVIGNPGEFGGNVAGGRFADMDVDAASRPVIRGQTDSIQWTGYLINGKLVVVCGIEPGLYADRAGAFLHMLNTHRSDADEPSIPVVFVGTAGALDRSLQPGDLVTPSVIGDANAATLREVGGVENQAIAVLQRLLTARGTGTSIEDGVLLGGRHGAVDSILQETPDWLRSYTNQLDVVEQEAADVAREAARSNNPLFVILRVSDVVGSEDPDQRFEGEARNRGKARPEVTQGDVVIEAVRGLLALSPTRPTQLVSADLGDVRDGFTRRTWQAATRGLTDIRSWASGIYASVLERLRSTRRPDERRQALSEAVDEMQRQLRDVLTRRDEEHGD